jgi:PAS domain S-box-containing protein/putative nucleotidyltransferase with HDIG domain
MEEELRESEGKLKNIVENSTNLFYSHTPEHVLTYLSPQVKDILGYKPDEAMVRWTELASDNPINEEGFKLTVKAIETGKPQPPYELELVHKNGKKVWVEVREAPVVVNGKTISIVGALTDITDRKQETSMTTVSALTSMVEMKDRYTAGHQPKVAQLACAIAEEMKLSNEQIEGIRIAGLVHDIGKIMVPAEILSKPGPLTDIQFDMVKMHPQAGYDILKGIKFPWPVAQIVLQHHERMDGSGYPQGLSGEEIILEARILGVANVVEAMTSHRPYRAAHDIKEALQEISQHKEIFYDPDVANACLKLFAKKRFTFD